MKIAPSARAVCSALSITLGLSLSCSSLAAGPLTVGISSTTDLRLGADARMGAAQTAPVELHSPGATYIKVHVAEFNLPEGISLELSNADGSEAYRYGSHLLDVHTVDATQGEDGRSAFGLMSLQGDRAILRLAGTAREPWTTRHGVRVVRYDTGLPQKVIDERVTVAAQEPGTPQAICRGNDLKAAICLAGSDPQAFQGARPVARLLINGTSLCTAWRVGSDNRMFTNNHCFDSAAGVAATEVWFNYQADACGGSRVAAVTKVGGGSLLKTDKALDYSLFTVRNFDRIAGFGHLRLDVRQPRQGQPIFIPQHPRGRLKEIAATSDAQGGGHCTLLGTSVNGGKDVSYSCDTQGGSSGSPVVSRESNAVIALHHLGWSNCTNSGARMDLIWPQVRSFFNGIVP